MGGICARPRDYTLALEEGTPQACPRFWSAFSDLFTDIWYTLAVPSLTTLGWVCLLPPPLLNLVGVVIMLRGYRDAVSG